MRKTIIQQYLLASFLVAILACLPFILHKELLLERNNDLTEFFWPIFFYIKESILLKHQFPITNEVFFAGTPLLSDPQNPIWYIPNVIFLLLSIDSAILISIFIHTIFAAFGSIILCKELFKWNNFTTLVIVFSYIFSSQYFSFLEAGHWGLIIVWSWLPYLMITTLKLAEKFNFKIALLFALSASSIYFGHILTFAISFFSVLVYLIYKRKIKILLFLSFLTFIFVSPALLSQLTWGSETTRKLLLKQPETFPIWMGKKDFFKSLFIFNPSTEKAITIGFGLSILASIGFNKIRNVSKIGVIFIVSMLLLLLLNNVSPIFPILSTNNFFILMRVSTRLWFIIFVLILYLAAIGIESQKRKIVMFLGLFVIVESILNAFTYFKKIPNSRDDIGRKIYEVFDKDNSEFRVLCLTRCIPQKQAAIHHLKLVEGYGTLQDISYYYSLQNALNETWQGYSLVLPPFDLYNKNIQPDPQRLLTFNTKYIISKKPLVDEEFKLVIKSDNYFVYKNNLWKQ